MSFESGELSGSTHQWYWASIPEELYVICKKFPFLLRDKFVAIVSYDSGKLLPGDSELQKGWTNENGIAYSPQLGSIDDILTAGYDEWYIFNSRTPISSVEVFVNSHIFPRILQQNGQTQYTSEDTKTLSRLIAQLDRLSPELFICDSESETTILTRDLEIIRKMENNLVPGTP